MRVEINGLAGSLDPLRLFVRPAAEVDILRCDVPTPISADVTKKTKKGPKKTPLLVVYFGLFRSIFATDVSAGVGTCKAAWKYRGSQ